jgi:hypothetical protein
MSKYVSLAAMVAAACVSADVDTGATAQPLASSLEATCANIDAITPDASQDTRAALCAAFSSVGALYHRINGALGCTATVIGPRTILTAGHCAIAGNRFGVPGSDDLVEVVRWTRAPVARGGYTDTGSDVAVGELERDVGLSPAPVGHLSAGDIDLVVVGVGHENPALTRAGTRRATAVSLLGTSGSVYGLFHGGYPSWFSDPAARPELRRRVYQELRVLEPYQAVLRASGGSMLCRGDSGGPILEVVSGRAQVVGVATALADIENCDGTFVAARLEAATADMIAQQLACPDLPPAGACDGDGRLRRCELVDGAYHEIATSCGDDMCGARADGGVACLAMPCRLDGDRCRRDGDTCLGPVFIRGPEDIAALSACAAIDGDLFVQGAESLVGLEALRRIDGSLWITDSRALPSLAGLSGLVEIGGDLVIERTGALRSAELPALERVGGDLSAQAGPAPLALPALRDVGGTLLWTSWQRFAGTGRLEHIGGNLEIVETSELPGPDALAGLRRVDGDVLLGGYRGDTADGVAMPQLERIGGSLLIGDDPVYRNFERRESRVLGGGPIFSSLDTFASLREVGNDLLLVGEAMPTLEPLRGLARIGGDVTVTRSARLDARHAADMLRDMVRRGVIGGVVDLWLRASDGSRVSVDACAELHATRCLPEAPGCVLASNRCWIPAPPEPGQRSVGEESP